MDEKVTEAPEHQLGEVEVVPRGACWAVASDDDHTVLLASRGEAMAAHYDRLAETHPIYAGMWRAMARILRRGAP